MEFIVISSHKPKDKDMAKAKKFTIIRKPNICLVIDSETNTIQFHGSRQNCQKFIADKSKKEAKDQKRKEQKEDSSNK